MYYCAMYRFIIIGSLLSFIVLFKHSLQQHIRPLSVSSPGSPIISLSDAHQYPIAFCTLRAEANSI